MNSYPTNLTDKQRQVIKNITETKERKRKHSLRKMIKLKKIIADGGYRGKLVDIVKDLGWELSVVLPPG